ncbi:MAG: hypothetical protein R2852_05910 [Bacteroidia bacterium]
MEKKEWKIIKVFTEHAFDFFSMFLAISLGFIVDSYKDSQNSKAIALEMSSDLISEICEDTASIKKLIMDTESKIKHLDKLFPLIDSFTSSPQIDEQIYKFAAHINNKLWFERHTITYNLLINTGYMQYFTKRASASLTRYDIACDRTIDILVQEKSMLNSKIFPFLQQIFHTENFHTILQGGHMSALPELHNWTKENRWLMHNYVFELRDINVHILGHLYDVQKASRNTLKVLNEEYTQK